MGYTYPAPPASLTGDVLSINRYLNEPTRVARDLRTLLQQRYIADALLTGRFKAVGGAVLYETGESIFPADPPQPVSPGGEYPLTLVSGGQASLAKTVKWGEDSEVTDEAISRQGIDPVSRGLTKLANQNVKTVDGVALAAIASAVTATQAVTASFATATALQILLDVMDLKADILALNQGYDPDSVVIDDVNWAIVMAKFAAAGFMPRENNAANPILTGEFPVIGGMRWMASPNIPTAGVLVVADSKMLGGMADEDIGGPGYVSAEGTGTAPVQVKTIRDDPKDQYRIRARRVTVPVVVEPAAAKKLTGV